MTTIKLTNVRPGHADVLRDGVYIGRVRRVTRDVHSDTWGTQQQREAAIRRNGTDKRVIARVSWQPVTEADENAARSGDGNGPNCATRAAAVAWLAERAVDMDESSIPLR